MSGSRKNRALVTALLLVGIATCLALLPWSRWFGGAPEHERLLTARVARYIELRKTDDWGGVYNLMDPGDRQRVSQLRYLQHVTGALKVHEMQEKAQVVDREKGVATVTLTMDAELVRNNLPAAIRNVKADAGATRSTAEFTLDWAWSEGNWWLRMDPVVMTGRTPDGRLINPGNSGPPAPAANSAERPPK